MDDYEWDYRSENSPTGVTYPDPFPTGPSIGYPPHTIIEPDLEQFLFFDEQQNIPPPAYNSIRTQHPQTPYPGQFGKPPTYCLRKRKQTHVSREG